MIYIRIIFSGLLFLPLLGFSQTQNHLPDTQKIISFLDSGDVYEFSVPEKAVNWYLKAILEINVILPYHNEMDFTMKTRVIDLYATAHRYVGIVYRRLGRCRESLEYHSTSLKYIELLRKKDKMILTWSNIGLAYLCLGNYEKALENFYHALYEAEKSADSVVMARLYINLGQVHEAQNEYAKALDYYEKSKEIKERHNDSTDLDIPYINIGNISYRTGNYNHAEYYFKKAGELFEITNDIQGISIISTNLALVEEKRGNYRKALDYLNKALKIDRELNDTLSIVIDLSTMGKIYTSLNNTGEALSILTKARNMAEKGNLHVQLQHIASLLSAAYESSGNPSLALFYLKQYNGLRDSLLSSEKTKRLAEMEVLYDTEKKQWQIESLTNEKRISDLEMTRKNQRMRLLLIIIVIVVSALSGIGILAIRLNRTSRARKLANAQLQQRNEEILHKNTEILAQRDEIDKQKQEIVKLYGEVTDSIIYAKRIQQATLPPIPALTQLFPSHFVLYLPKDIVGGDFYFVHKAGDYTVLAVGDCTGHGVPGGFMSMMGMAFLREIVNGETASDPALILNRMRERIIASLQQYHQGEHSDKRSSYNDIKVKDGMDMGIVSIHRPTGKVLYSGANNTLVIVKKGEASELKGSKMPVSVYVRMDHFENQEAFADLGSCLYLCTDGYSDQFGGPSGKKYGRSRFVSLLGQIAGRPMHNQRKELEEELTAWKGRYEQTDDVTVIGIGIS
jgi:serine phosphatase RsbU (regulator of sigma subunit)/Tfp pilus assembly protein PilF